MYTPINDETQEIMGFFGSIFRSVVGVNDTEALEEYFLTHGINTTFAGIQFPIEGIKTDIPITIR